MDCPECWGCGFPQWWGLWICDICGLWWGFTGGVRSEIGFGSGLLPWCTRCTAFELFSFTSSKRLPISGFSPPMKNKNSQRIRGISTNQWRTLKLQRKLFIFLGGENRRTACFESHAVSHYYYYCCCCCCCCFRKSSY